MPPSAPHPAMPPAGCGISRRRPRRPVDARRRETARNGDQDGEDILRLVRQVGGRSDPCEFRRRRDPFRNDARQPDDLRREASGIERRRLRDTVRKRALSSASRPAPSQIGEPRQDCCPVGPPQKNPCKALTAPKGRFEETVRSPISSAAAPTPPMGTAVKPKAM